MFSMKSFAIIVLVLFVMVTSEQGSESENVVKEGNAGATVEKTGSKTQLDETPKAGDDKTAISTTAKPKNVSNSDNSTGIRGGDETRYSLMDNKGMLMRSFFVFLGITSIVVMYFGVKAFRTRRRKSKSRKYGLITSRGADLEMEPLDQDMDEDDDMTVFEVNGRQK